MDSQRGLEELSQIHCADGFSAPSRWPYHTQFSSSLMSQASLHRSPILAGIGLHSNISDFDFPLIELDHRYVQGLNASPFSSELLYADRKTSEFALYPSYDTSCSELYRHDSPLTDGSSSPSQTCDTSSASHVDELHHQHDIDFMHLINNPLELIQGHLPHGAHANLLGQPPGIPFGGGCSNISLDKIQNFQDTAFEHDQEHASSELDADCDSDHECHDIPLVRRLSVLPYPEDKGIGDSIKDESIRDSMSDRFDNDGDDDEEEQDDPEYTPKSARRNPKPTTRTRPTSTRRTSHTRKPSTTSTPKTRIAKPKSKKPTTAAAAAAGLLHPFPCPLAPYGCKSTFTSKNEWKRHVSTQHVKLGFWRCDMCPRTDDAGGNIIHNDFNRKDLFTQHLRRMHTAHPFSRAGASSSAATRGGMGGEEEDVAAHQARCYVRLRSNPLRSGCLFCPRSFEGEGSWEERMEHVGAHFEAERRKVGGGRGVGEWRVDVGLREWLEGEGLIEFDEVKGGWRIGDGRPRRRDSVFG